MHRSLVRLVVCVNERLGTGQRSCVASGNYDYIAEIRRLLEAEGLEIPIVERECLGKCEQGPVMRIAPGGSFYTEINNKNLPEIVEALQRMKEQQEKGIDADA